MRRQRKAGKPKKIMSARIMDINKPIASKSYITGFPMRFGAVFYLSIPLDYTAYK